MFFNLIFAELAFAQITDDHEAPVIVHFPVKTALRGQTITIVARVADNAEVGSVTVNFKKEGRFLDVPLPMNKTKDDGEVKLKVTAEAAYVFSSPTLPKDTVATVTKDEVFEIYEEDISNQYYHIRISDAFDGWLSVKDAEPVMTGAIYVGIIPAFVTMTSEVVYRIAAEDISFNKISTLNYRVKIIDPERHTEKTKEPPAPKEKIKPPSGRPFYAKWWFWGTVVLTATGAGVYYYLQQQKKEKGNINVEVEW
jgi:hypothetical protein